jgi:hypothetical protein
VYAPRRSVRVRLAGGQLRAVGDYSSVPGNESHTVLQNSYLLDVKKYWKKGNLLSDLGLAAYTVEADAPDYTDLSALTNDGAFESNDADDGSGMALGRLNAYRLNLGLQPTPRSKIELRHEIGRLTYYFDDGVRSNEHLVSSRIRYSQFLRNCTRLQGSFSTSTDSDRIDFSIARDGWNINFSRALDNGAGDTAVHIAYVLPLVGSRSGTADCGSTLENVPAFGPIVDTAIKRPQQFPRAPLAKPAS